MSDVAAASAAGRPRADEAAREVRFAVVMYGGVSLAIYINGIAQELLRLVRATAPGAGGADAHHLATDDELTGTERVYRRIARMLDANGGWQPGAAAADGVTTRFVVDVLSGTSAGGINAVFLAKALATGRDIDALRRLWVDEGAIELLVYDGLSEFDAVPAPARPPSLLNGRRMYRKLLDAFDGVDGPAGAAPRAPLVPEVDLFVTTTDIDGLPIALRLADGVVAERRHRNVFHFRFPREGREPGADFARTSNAFLAFASRCTSAFPFAFEPMTLRDVDDVRRRAPGHEGAGRVADDGGAWRRFFPAYQGRARTDAAPDAAAPSADARSAEPWLRALGGHLADRAFGDGGYLDNKPFGHAIDALTSRRASVAVDRKLLYVEPSPEPPRDPAAGRPNAIENTYAALTLARHETIREDLQRILERNRLVERVERVLEGLDDDIAASDGAHAHEESPDYEASDLRVMIAAEGPAYGGYHRLKVSALTDEIAQYVAALAGYDRQSDEFVALRHLVSAWRTHRYAAYVTPRDDGGPGAWEAENLFLLRYDLTYRRRRLEFVLGRIDQLLCADDRAAAMLNRVGLDSVLAGDGGDPFLDALRTLRAPLTASYRELQALRAALLSGEGVPEPWRAAVAGIRLTRAQMLDILAPPTTTERVEEAWRTIEREGLAPALGALEAALAATVRAVTERAAERCKGVLGVPDAPIDRADPASVARGAVAMYYHRYGRYDQIVFPAYFSTDLGEEMDVVDVHRVSPEDATALIDERCGDGRRKLAGTALGNFGAFLDRRWRWNDLLWGRLDAAERLIHILLPGGGAARERARADLVKEAHCAIVGEAFADLDAETLAGAVVRARLGSSAAPGAPARRAAPRADELLTVPGSVLAAALRDRLTPEALHGHFAAAYQVPRDLVPEPTLRVAARATRVVGRMLEGMAGERRRGGAMGRAVARAGSLLWGVIEVAVPQSMAHLVARHVMQLLYALGAFVTLAGAVLVDGAVQRFGVLTLAVTALLHLTVWVIRDLLHGRRRWLAGVAAAGAVALGLTTALGVWTVTDGATRAILLGRMAAWAGRVRWGVVAAAAAALAAVIVGAIAIETVRRWRARRRAEGAPGERGILGGLRAELDDYRAWRAERAERRRGTAEPLPYDRRAAPPGAPAPRAETPRREEPTPPR